MGNNSNFKPCATLTHILDQILARFLRWTWYYWVVYTSLLHFILFFSKNFFQLQPEVGCIPNHNLMILWFVPQMSNMVILIVRGFTCIVIFSINNWLCLLRRIEIWLVMVIIWNHATSMWTYDNYERINWNIFPVSRWQTIVTTCIIDL